MISTFEYELLMGGGGRGDQWRKMANFLTANFAFFRNFRDFALPPPCWCNFSEHNAINFYRENGTFLGDSKIIMSPPLFFYNPCQSRPDPSPGQNRVFTAPAGPGPAKNPIPVGY